jgi:cholesterol oxidase
MGEDRDGGVVDHKCRVFDASPGCAKDAVHDGLYVCDASVIPCALGVHPLLTITAVAERAMLLLARELGRSLDVEPVVGRGRAVPMPAVETSQATIDGVASSAPATATSNA